MSEVIKSPFQAAIPELIRKLVNAGYLGPAKRHDPDANTQAIARMKDALRGNPAEDDGPRVA
jgi:hypothetical protein